VAFVILAFFLIFLWLENTPMTGQKFDLEIPAYYDYEAILPVEYFEVKLSMEENRNWLIYFVDESGNESTFGPFDPPNILNRITMGPFYFEEIVFVYYLVESLEESLRDLGVELLKLMANR